MGKIPYRPAISEQDYLADSIQRTLGGRAFEARQLAISQLIGRLEQPTKPKGRRKAKKP